MFTPRGHYFGVGGWHIQLGDLGTWIGSVGTVLAFVAGYLLLRREADRDAERQADRRREQASQITIWRADAPDSSESVIDEETGTVLTRTQAPLLHVGNASNRPIFGAFVVFVDDDAVEHAKRKLGEVEVGIVAPGEICRVPIPTTVIGRGRGRTTGDVHFTDANGERWSRRTDGGLGDTRSDEQSALYRQAMADLAWWKLRRRHGWRKHRRRMRRT